MPENAAPELPDSTIRQFLSRADNLLLAVLGLPLAFSFSKVADVWLRNDLALEDQLLGVVGLSFLFLMQALGYSIFSYGVLFLAGNDDEHRSVIRSFPILLVLMVVASMVMATASQASASAAIATKVPTATFTQSLTSSRFIGAYLFFLVVLQIACIILCYDEWQKSKTKPKSAFSEKRLYFIALAGSELVLIVNFDLLILVNLIRLVA